MEATRSTGLAARLRMVAFDYIQTTLQTLFALVQREGMPATNIVVYGNNPAIVQRRGPTAQPSYENEPATTMQPGPQLFLPFQTPSNTFDPSRIY